MNWQQFLASGEKAVKIVRSGLIKRNIKAGEPIVTEFNTDEDIPVYDDKYNKRKSSILGEVHYLYPSYCVPNDQIISKLDVISHIQKLAGKN